MIKDVVDACVVKLKQIDWLTTDSDVFGLVRAEVKTGNDPETGKPFRNIFPVVCGDGTDDCAPGKFQYATPDTKKNAVIWFEDLGTRPVGTLSGGKHSLVSAFRLVCWLNSVKFTTDACVLSSIAIQEFIHALTAVPVTGNIYVKLTGIPAKDYSVLTKWSFNQKTGFTSSDFDYFHIDFNVTQVIGNCEDTLTLSKDACV